MLIRHAATLAGVALLGAGCPAAAQSAAPQAVAAAALVERAYSINPGDEIEIFVWGDERLQRQLRVLPDGSITFPLVGQLNVQGMVPTAVAEQVSQKLRGQYRGDVPNVTVSVRNPAGMQFSVMGRVRSPGSFTTGRYVNLLDALSLAGGPSEFASLDGVSIVRHENGRLVTLRARLSSLFKGAVDQGDLVRANVVGILPGDIVIVP